MKILDFFLVLVIATIVSFGVVFLDKKTNENIIITVDIVKLIELKTEQMDSPNVEALEIFSKALESKLRDYASRYGKDILVKQTLATDTKTLDITNLIREELIKDGLYK